MSRRLFKILGILLLTVVCMNYVTRQENLFQKASNLKLTGPAHLKFTRHSYNLNFKKLSDLDEIYVDSEIKKIHQISRKLTATSISNNTSNDGEIMITLAKSIDDTIVLVIFKNKQIQMIQKISNFTEDKIEFQYGELIFSEKPLKLSGNQNVELEF
jgi:hypothetical protein